MTQSPLHTTMDPMPEIVSCAKFLVYFVAVVCALYALGY